MKRIKITEGFQFNVTKIIEKGNEGKINIE